MEIKKFNRRMEYDASVHARHSKKVLPLVANSSALAKQFQRIIHVQSEAGREYGHKQGRLSSRLLYRVPSGGEEVFYKRTTPKITKNCAVTILGDFSGSMSADNKVWTLAASFIMLNEALTSVQVPFEILGFSEQSEGPLFITFKGFNQRSTKEELLEHTGVVIRNLMGDNPDGEALLWAYSRLRVRPEKRKVLIVLSDGQPSCGAPGDAAQHLKCVVQEMQKKIDVVGIGLMSDSVRVFYKEHYVVNDVSKLSAAFLSTLRTKII